MCGLYIMSAFATEFDFIFTIARMNPPTPGHKELVKQMMITALENGNKPVYVGLSSTCCKEDNPLTCDEKKALVELMILRIKEENDYLENITTKVICSDDVGSAIMFNLASKIILENNNKGNGLMFFGDDYVGCNNSQGITECLIEDTKKNYSMLKSQFEHLYFAPPLVRKIDSNVSLTLENGIEIPLPSSGMSATFIRNLTLNSEAEFKKEIAKHYPDNETELLRLHQREIFNNIMSNVTSDIETRIISNGKTLFDLIQERYSKKTQPGAKTQSKKTTLSKKTQPGAKTQSKKKVGGKKTRTTKRRSRK